MRTRRMLQTLVGLVAASLLVATTDAADGKSPAQNDLIASHFNYYDELDLKRYESLEAEFGDSCRVFSSLNAVRFGQLEVRAKLIVPRSDADAPGGFLRLSHPAPVRVMFDYALVSCRKGCEMVVQTDPGATTHKYPARHDSESRSMVLTKDKETAQAIRQLNASQRARIVLAAAAHGVAEFEFDTSVGSDPKQ